MIIIPDKCPICNGNLDYEYKYDQYICVKHHEIFAFELSRDKKFIEFWCVYIEIDNNHYHLSSCSQSTELYDLVLESKIEIFKFYPYDFINFKNSSYLLAKKILKLGLFVHI